MKRAIVLDDYQDVAMTSADWSPLTDRVNVDVRREGVDPRDLVDVLRGYDIVVAMRERTVFDGPTLRALPELELLVTTGPVNSVIDVATANELGIPVTGTRGYLPAAHEHTWAMLLACAKSIAQVDRGVKEGEWQTTVSKDLNGARLGIVGLGRYGAMVASMAQAFGMETVAWSPNLTQERCDEVGGVAAVSKGELFETSDFITIHMVLSERTRGLVSSTDLWSMKSSAYLVNTSRGPLVDERALVSVLKEGRIAGAGLDVFETEPLPAEHPLRGLANVTLSPHMGYVTERQYAIFFGDVVENIAAFLDGSVIRRLESDSPKAPEDPYWTDVQP